MSTNAAVIRRFDRAQILRAATSIGILGGGASGAPRIMAAICKPDVTAMVISGLLAKEPALYARVLRVANSPYYGQSRSITTVERALVLLGLSAVRGIAAAACLDRTLARDRSQQWVDLKALMHHSHATAVAAQMLAEVCRPTLAAEAFIAGLLHNLGVAVQIHLDAGGVKAMVELRRDGDARGIRLLESERAAVSHEECVAVVFETWQMPASLIEAARHHHDPMQAPEAFRHLACLVNLGATLGLAQGSTHTLEPAPVIRNSAAMQFLGLTENQIDELAGEFPMRFAELSAALLDG